MTASPDADTAPTDPGVSVVLNALSDVVNESRFVLGDDASLGRARSAFEDAVPSDRRAAFREHLRRTQPDSDGPGNADEQLLREVAVAVAEELAERGVGLRLDHRATVPLPDRTARLYTYMTTEDPDVLDPLELPSPVDDGVDAAVAGDYERAAAAFDAAVDAAGAGPGAIATRTLAGWALHRAGSDGEAMDYVEEALHLRTDAIGPTCVGLAAGHRHPEKFRTGKLGARFFLRCSQEVPSGGSMTADVGLPASDGSREWRPLEGPPRCQCLERLAADTPVRLRVEGRPTAFPALFGYYVALGVVDLEVDEVRGVEKMILSGPDTTPETETSETLWLVNDGSSSHR